MSVLPSLLFGISASLDALLVGCALGLQKVPLPVKHNLLISAVTLIGTVISISLGNLLLPLIPGEIATRTGSSILILFGLYYTGNGWSPDGAAVLQITAVYAGRRKNLPNIGI